MSKNKLIKFYVSSEQAEIIRKTASQEGYKTISEFLRDLSLNKNNLFRERFFEMYNKVMGEKNDNWRIRIYRARMVRICQES